ncbi:magnesium transporter [Candidatus Gracilibacteria bacterium]|nr:magnesium transporter [Candidatus Gracilibacteria bacterium]
MPFFSEFFFSTLVGKPVYTVDEKYFGEFRDFIVKRQNENFIVSKVRIRVGPGKRVILPWRDVYSIEADPVSLKLKKTSDQIESLDYDENELRLKRDFLDQQIIDIAEHRVVRVNDLRMVAVKDELFMVAADIGVRGLMRRVGFEWFALWIANLFKRSVPNNLIPSKFIDPFPARVRHDITLTVAQDEMKKLHPADLADIVTDLDQFERISMLQSLPVETMARTIAELEPEIRKELMSKLKDDTLKKVLERLAPDAATDIVAELPKRRMHSVLDTMKSADAEEIRELLKFKEDTAGSIMNTEYVALKATLTAKEALDELRKKGDQAEQIFYVYLVDTKGILVGVISLRDLIFVNPDKLLMDIVKREPIFVRGKENLDEVIDKFTKYNLIAIPVVTLKKRLKGVITVDDVLRLIQEQSQ